MRRIIYTVILFLALLISYEGMAQYLDGDGKWWVVHEGTTSHRKDGTVTSPVEPDTLFLGTHYGSAIGGARTPGWNSSDYAGIGYDDLSLFTHSNLNAIDEISDISVIPRIYWSGGSGFPYWTTMNARFAKPPAYLANPGSGEKYPMIVMMHGVGETGSCRGTNCKSITDPDLWNNDHNLLHGGEKHLQAMLRDPSDPRHWPGFVLFPQSSNGWGSLPNNRNVLYVHRLIRAMLTKYPIDPNQIYIHGLSNGASGVYYLVYDHPDLFAAMQPMSGTEPAGYELDYGTTPPFGFPVQYPPSETLVHIPIRQFQGGQDQRPLPSTTMARLQPIIDDGGNVIYFEYPDRGHAVWNPAYDEPDFFSWFRQYSKLKIHTFYGITEICEGSTQKLGLTSGYMAYEWQKSTDGGATYSPFPSIPGRPHEILADEGGHYRVRFQRDEGNGQTVVPVWTEWSEPFVLTERIQPTAKIETNGSWVLWGLNNNTSLTLSADKADADYYYWYKGGALYASGANLNQIVLDENGEGIYTLVYDDNFCTSIVSEPIYVNRAPTGGGEPAAPSNLQGAPTSTTTSTIWWTDNALDEIGYEIYRSLDGGVNYTWLGNFEENKVTYSDSNLPSGQEVFYKVRAFNENGASSEATVSINLPNDITPPTVPGNFSFVRFQIEEVRTNPETYTGGDEPITMYDENFIIHMDSALFTWEPSESEGILYYDIYNENDNVIGTTQDTSYVVSGLEENKSYSFYVKARQPNNITSGKSQLGTVFTAFSGLYYYYYVGAIWDVIKEFSFHAYSDEGTTNNFLINYIPGHNDPDYFAYDFFAFLNIEQPGTYNFSTRSDDGSALYIDNTLVVENDGLHGMRTRYGSMEFTEPGIHRILVKYFERNGGSGLEVKWDPPGPGGYISIPDHLLTSTLSAPADPPAAPSGLSATANGYSMDLNWSHVYSNMHVVVLGSSTAAGVGATTPEDSWAEKFKQALLSQNPSNTFNNLAFSGFTTYDILPSGNPTRNITAALAENPDVIIVNLPSNDAANGFDLETETLPNMMTVKAEADAAGVEIYFTTTQPRNLNQAGRDRLAEEATRIQQIFGGYSINIYDELNDGNGFIKTEYNFDGTHLNDDGHNYLYQTIWNQVNNQSIPLFEVFRSENGGPFSMVLSTNKQQVSITDPNLLAVTQYDYKVRASTSTGKSAFSNTDGDMTAGDAEPPTIPQNFREAATTESEITVVWDASSDNVAVDHYVVVEVTGGAGGRTGSVTGKTNDIEVGQTTLTSLTITGLAPLETFDLAVYAVDQAGNPSANSNVITVQTQAPLPVEFLDVSHRITEDGVLVTWATATELNNAFFTVERGTGLEDFTAIGGVEGSGTTTTRRDYLFLDTKPLDLAYYRIKQTDFDGKFEYSKIIRVVYNASNLEQFTVYPNPTVQENINARGYVPSNRPSVEVRLLDVMGKVHMARVLDPNEFLNGLKLNLDYAVPPGVYIIQISDGTNNTQRRVVIR